MCKAQDHPIMVMDVEGTDGRERGEDQVSRCCNQAQCERPKTKLTRLALPRLPFHRQDFERKSALFSLASSEVLLVNLWEHQVSVASPSIDRSR
jgi:hypothetical protein